MLTIRCGEKDWHDRDLIGIASISSGYVLDGIGALSFVDVKRSEVEPDHDYRLRVMARLLAVIGREAAPE